MRELGESGRGQEGGEREGEREREREERGREESERERGEERKRWERDREREREKEERKKREREAESLLRGSYGVQRSLPRNCSRRCCQQNPNLTVCVGRPFLLQNDNHLPALLLSLSMTK